MPRNPAVRWSYHSFQAAHLWMVCGASGNARFPDENAFSRILCLKDVTLMLVAVRLIHCCYLMFSVQQGRVLLSEHVFNYYLNYREKTCIFWTARDVKQCTSFSLGKYFIEVAFYRSKCEY